MPAGSHSRARGPGRSQPRVEAAPGRVRSLPARLCPQCPVQSAPGAGPPASSDTKPPLPLARPLPAPVTAPALRPCSPAHGEAVSEPAATWGLDLCPQDPPDGRAGASGCRPRSSGRGDGGHLHREPQIRRGPPGTGTKGRSPPQGQLLGYRGQGAPSLAGGRSSPRCRGEGPCCRVTVLFQEDMVGLVEPINSRITDPRYFLNTPQQGKASP